MKGAGEPLLPLVPDRSLPLFPTSQPVNLFHAGPVNTFSSAQKAEM